MEQGPAQEHFNHLDQSVYRNESFSDVSGSFTVGTDAHYIRFVSCSLMLFQCAYEETIKNKRTALHSRFTF